jgi:hypothetical protein
MLRVPEQYGVSYLKAMEHAVDYEKSTHMSL